MPDSSENVGQRRPTREEVDQLCRGTRKRRSIQACYLCRSRKVKCDYSRPCRRCVERKHENLCTFNPDEEDDNPVASVSLPESRIRDTPVKRPRLEVSKPRIASHPASTSASIKAKDTEGAPRSPRQTDESNYGPNSIPSFVLHEVQRSSPLPEQIMMKNMILLMLGLQEPPIHSYTYPSAFLYVQKELREYLPEPKEIMESVSPFS